jgi:hypothetical protein
MNGERIVTRTAAPVCVFALLLLALAFLGGCETARYERGSLLAEDELTETLFLSGEEFRLEKVSDQGTILFTGLLQVTGEEWRFAIQTWRSAGGALRRYTPEIVYVYRGRSFQNGIAFYSLLSPRHPAGDFLFIRAPCDFDIVR